MRTFSRGMQQRLAIGRAILHEPHVLLFDEPYTGLDQDAGTMLDTLLSSIAQEGHTIIMTTHDLNRALLLSSQVAILTRGRIAYTSPSRDIQVVDFPALYTEVTGTVTAR